MAGWLKKMVSPVRTFSDNATEGRRELFDSSTWIKVAGVMLLLYLLVGFVLAVFWSREPDLFSVREVALNEVSGDESRLAAGVHTTAALIHVINVMLEKPGGYLTNDISFPGIWMDNVPNWEYGVLIQSRDMVKALREAFSRSQSQSLENTHLGRAEPQLNFNNNSWLMPQTESEYKASVEHLRKYLHVLADSDSSNMPFYSRADNLRYWLSTVESRLGSLAQRLSASVGQRRLNTDLLPTVLDSQLPSQGEELIKTPWHNIDDVFYEARGSTWALIHFLKAVEVDFAPILDNKNARTSLRQIIRELEATQETLYSPMILNGSGFGVLANHSLVMASYISRANAGIINLRELLSQG